MRPILEQAIALYQGDLLPSIYDEWLLSERERLSQRFITALRSQLNFEIVQDVVGSMLLNVEGVALGFFSYQYPLLEQPVLIEQVQVAGLLDIGLMKLDAIASRGYSTLFVILSNSFSLTTDR